MVEFLKSATSVANYFEHDGKEVCFIGRSNVGKSTLINKLTNSKIARTSKTPGRTRLINFFAVDNHIFVDLPGYGFAYMSKQNKREIDSMVAEYFTKRANEKLIFALIDSKVGVTRLDEFLFDFLKSNNQPFWVLCTKLEKAKQADKERTLRQIKLFTPHFTFISAHQNRNLDLVKSKIAEFFWK